ncbi:MULTISPECIES: hypothetical protein [Vagococcus]|uniref:Uncharacterized protein n=1 Tax=Vagococcus fluvialis bH819 TaxID=1255619 RepID=A0A1X6WQ30_9ENTE|nr:MULTISPECIES: hypothetical protein [Vagococcus]SLM86368.1 hypothetical protein FM121_09775 [Vagococcus fluvialis bH819]HCM89022.1 hypothetical protein [Vagococcus sp.]
MESKLFVETNPKLAERKLELQKLQLNFIRNGNNKKRIEEQEQVLELLCAHPELLHSEKANYDTNENSLYKYLNILTAYASNDEKYNSLKKYYGS